MQAGHVHAASKVLGEQAAWKFVQDEKPGFVLNTILPNMNYGPILDPASQTGSSASGLKKAAEVQDFGFAGILPRQLKFLIGLMTQLLICLNFP